MRSLILFIFLSAAVLHAQDSLEVSALPLDTAVSLKADTFIGIDSYNNFYYVKDRTLYKKSQDKTIQFSDLRLGTISTVDLLNPLRITVFYAETNTAVILDNTLNEITRVNFSAIENFRNVSQARTASDRRLWIFNTDLQRLELFDYQNNRVDSNFTPQADIALELASDFNTCWVLSEDNLYHYNQYGSLLEKLPATSLANIAILDENLFGIQDQKLFIKTKQSASWQEIKNLPQDTKAFYLKAGNLYLYRLEKISTYTLKLPKS